MKYVYSILAVLVAVAAHAAEKPRLVVNVVVSQLRYDHLDRIKHNFDTGGILKIMNEGMVFSDARYDYMNTTSAAGLATLATGTEPSTHGVVSAQWVDYTTGRRMSLIDDQAVYGLGCDAGRGAFSPQNLGIPTLGDRLRETSPGSRVVTIAADPLSAVVLGGTGGSQVFWMDEGRGCWGSSTAYMDALPAWVVEYNDRRVAREWLENTWRPLLGLERYVMTADAQLFQRNAGGYADLLKMPAGNTLVTDFARLAIDNERLGQDDDTDLLNICFDTPRLVGRLYGSGSQEVEDVLYRLDMEIGNLLIYLGGKFDMKDVVVVLTSDHGVSDSYDGGRVARDRFNASQFMVILNGFLNAQYGAGDWVADYVDRQVFLNRSLIYQKGMSLEEVQNRAAAFALEFRGVSHVLTSTAMQNSYFGGSYAQKMQNSFYPRRGGDLTINLMPGWIEMQDGVRASSGSMYGYDVHVPLMILGVGRGIVARTVNPRDLAPTLARIMQISRPIAAEGQSLL